MIGKEVGQKSFDDPGREVEHDEDGGAEHDEGGAEAAKMARDRKMDHLLDRVEV